MTNARSATVDAGQRRPPARLGLWNRQIDRYPDKGARYTYLGIVVLATIVLYYQLYISGAVGPQIISHYDMSFRYFVYITVVSNAVGAFSSLVAGLADRWGRANLVTYGLLVTGALTAFAVPNAPGKFLFAFLVACVGFVEGIILVATPALVRDFSPQLGRASAMGFWTLGPVIGSLVVTEVSSHTLTHLHAWQDQYIIAGITGLAVFVIAFFGLRELSPRLRDQLMVSMHDRALIEARAQGVDIEESLRHPWRQMLKLDIVGSAFAISVFLLIYYAAVGFFVIYFSSVFGFSTAQANGIGNWFWAFDAGTLVVVGMLSDLIKVRKPFMVVGAVIAIIMTIIFATRATQPHTSYYTFALIITVLSMGLGIAYAPWMASFTETVERRNPALTATGLAVWGWIIRIVVSLSALFLPIVVSSATPLVQYGNQVQALATKYAAELKTAAAIDPATLATLSANPSNGPALVRAITEISTTNHRTPAEATADLVALSRVPRADLAYLNAHGAAVQQASKNAPHEWQTWWWVCLGGQVVFIPLVFVMAGRWRPSSARRDAEAHERLVQAELAQLAGAGTPAGR